MTVVIASAELQKLVYETLVADPDVHALVADRIFDRPPEDHEYPCVAFGSSDYEEEDSDCVDSQREDLQLECWVEEHGRLRPAKDLADRVRAALHNVELSLAQNALVSLRVPRWRVFRAPDGVRTQGLLFVEAIVEIIPV